MCAACSYLGVAVKRVYRTRVEFYGDVLTFLSLAASEIGYLKTPILKLLERFTPKNRHTAEIFEKIVSALSDNCRERILTIKSLYVKRVELNELSNYFMHAGKSELKEELNLIKALEEKVKSYHKQAIEDSKRLGDLYFKLLVLLGVTLLLIVI